MARPQCDTPLVIISVRRMLMILAMKYQLVVGLRHLIVEILNVHGIFIVKFLNVSLNQFEGMTTRALDC
jgi:hypothetical protein